MEKYRQASQEIHEIFEDYTDLIEPLSLDEAFLDVSESDSCRGSGTLMAREIRQRVKKDVGITLSAGIAPNKFLAKIASDWNKPDGQFVITPDEVAAFVVKLPVRKLHGVGKMTARKMEYLDIATCADLQQLTKLELAEHFGSFGETLYSLSRGIDEREVKTERESKSISVERTYAEDLTDLSSCLARIPELIAKLRERIARSKKQISIGKQFVKIKFHDFVSTTIEQVSTELDEDVFKTLMKQGFERGDRPVRLLGIGIRMRPAPGSETFKQLQLRLESDESKGQVL